MAGSPTSNDQFLFSKFCQLLFWNPTLHKDSPDPYKAGDRHVLERFLLTEKEITKPMQTAERVSMIGGGYDEHHKAKKFFTGRSKDRDAFYEAVVAYFFFTTPPAEDIAKLKKILEEQTPIIGPVSNPNAKPEIITQAEARARRDKCLNEVVLPILKKARHLSRAFANLNELLLGVEDTLGSLPGWAAPLFLERNKNNEPRLFGFFRADAMGVLRVHTQFHGLSPDDLLAGSFLAELDQAWLHHGHFLMEALEGEASAKRFQERLEASQQGKELNLLQQRIPRLIRLISMLQLLTLHDEKHFKNPLHLDPAAEKALSVYLKELNIFNRLRSSQHDAKGELTEKSSLSDSGITSMLTTLLNNLGRLSPPAPSSEESAEFSCVLADGRVIKNADTNYVLEAATPYSDDDKTLPQGRRERRETQNVFLAPLIQDLALTHQTAGLEKLALLLDVLHQPTHEDVLSCFAGICAMRDNLRGVELPDPSAQSSDQDTKAESGAPEAKAESADPVADPASPEDAPDELAAHDNELEEDSELTVGVGAEATALEEFSLGDFRKKAVAAFKRNAAMTQIYQDGRKVELPLAWSDRARLFNKLSVAIFQHLKNNEKITSYARSELEKRLRFAQKYDTTAVERLTQYLAEINAISKAPEQIKTELAELNSKLRDGRMLSALQLFMIVKEIDERLSHTAEKDFNTRGQLFFSGYALLNVYACLYKPGPRVPENVVINNPNETRLTQMNCTLLMLAVQQKHSRLVSILCQKTAQFSEAGDPNLQDARGNTLFKRIQTNDVETLKIILNSERLAPETINQRGSKSEKSRLKVALENKEREVALWLLAAGAYVDEKEFSTLTQDEADFLRDLIPAPLPTQHLKEGLRDFRSPPPNPAGASASEDSDLSKTHSNSSDPHLLKIRDALKKAISDYVKTNQKLISEYIGEEYRKSDLVTDTFWAVVTGGLIPLLGFLLSDLGEARKDSPPVNLFGNILLSIRRHSTQHPKSLLWATRLLLLMEMMIQHPEYCSKQTYVMRTHLVTQLMNASKWYGYERETYYDHKTTTNNVFNIRNPSLKTHLWIALLNPGLVYMSDLPKDCDDQLKRALLSGGDPYALEESQTEFSNEIPLKNAGIFHRTDWPRSSFSDDDRSVDSENTPQHD